MKPDLCITFRFIQPFPLFHGRRDSGKYEWPPSPMRAFQAILNAAGLRSRGRPLAPEVRFALQAIEVLRPEIIAPRATVSTVGYRAYVPHNQYDLVTAAFHRGMDQSTAAFRKLNGSVRSATKDYLPVRIEKLGDYLPTLHYLYPLDATTLNPDELLRAIRPAVRSITHLGWGIDQVVADAMLIDRSTIESPGERWQPSDRAGRRLRVHQRGSLDALSRRHGQFLDRLRDGDWTPVPPLSAIDQVRYRRESDPVPRPYAVFKLVDANDDTASYPQSKLIHIAGMVKHLAVEMMKDHPPHNRDLRGIDPVDWVRAYVAGHQSKDDKDAGAAHTQFSYVPLQSIGNPNADPGVRRVMIVAPLGDEAWLEHLASRLDGVPLKPLPNTKLSPGTRLGRIDDKKRDGVRDAYLSSSSEWASVTPVILPGHDDHKPDKTRKLIEKALAQSGIDQPCEFKWSAFSKFRKMLPAHKYRKDPADPSKKFLINYVRPDHLLEQSAVHLTLRFAHPVPGPLTVGSGRHCGFGLMAAVAD